MTTRTIQECDRCRREIKKGDKIATVILLEGKDKDLCSDCNSKLGQFMQGMELDEPP